MLNLLAKDIRLGVPTFFLFMPLLTGALMFIPAWIYFLVLLYFCWITVPAVFGGLKANNDLIFTAMLPVSKKDMVKARVGVIVLLEALHVGVAMIFGAIAVRLYPNMEYLFFKPSLGFWGLSLVMLGIFNLIFIAMYYRTSYHYGMPTSAAIGGAMLFAGLAQWAGIQNSYLFELFNGPADRIGVHASILAAGLALFILLTLLAYRFALSRFLRVEIQ